MPRSPVAYISIPVLVLVGALTSEAGVSPWTHQYDFDGDGAKDRVEVSFSGGAHCCYRVGVRLAGKRHVISLPFELDGGYMGGLNLSQPSHFNVRDYNGDGRPDLCMEIATYNGKRHAIPKEWTERYGVRTNRVLVTFPKAEAKVQDYRCKCDAKPTTRCTAASV